ncbi:MAG TPA: hypothetical protein VET65_01420 [Candidatus Limnocylindrales bacterium]|nr:hypothetical protein [Candidatus Limnocylindrales bacterium]
MGATATLTTKAATVQPGGETSCEIRIRNSGTVVDQFTLEVLGDAAGWAIVEPATLSLFPGAEATARIRFKPPKVSSVQARAIPFAVRVKSREDARASMVEEGVVEVGAFTDTFAELIPRSARGSNSARAQLALDNRGNTRINARLTASDPDRKLNFSISPPGIVAEPGTASFARIRLSPRQRFFTGPVKTLPYKVFVHQDGQAPLAVDGVMIQEGLLPGWLIPALVGLLALAVVAVVLWLTVLQQAIKSTAINAIASPVASASAAASRAVAAAGGATSTSGGTKTGGGGSNPVGGSPTSARITPNSLATPYDPQGALAMTDLIFENPNANSGTLTLEKVTSSGHNVLLQLRLENFRDLDFHFVSPIVLQSGDKLALECVPQTAGAPCDASLYYSGYLK